MRQLGEHKKATLVSGKPLKLLCPNCLINDDAMSTNCLINDDVMSTILSCRYKY